MHRLFQLSRNGNYWLMLAGLCLLMEVTALLYQYVLDEPPCVVCIHVRIGVLAVFLLAIAGWLLRSINSLAAMIHLGIAAVSAVMLERAWELFGTERGFIIGSCDFNLGLPDWLALDRWLPAVFEVQTTCGYTPVLFFGITMAEALLFLFAMLLLSSLLLAGLHLKAGNSEG